MTRFNSFVNQPFIRERPKSAALGSAIPKRGSAHLTLAVILSFHVLATCAFFPPGEALRSEPLQYTDHPVHAHRVYMYREGLRESGLPWGYDPAVSAGIAMQPDQDAGARPQEVLSILLPGLSAGAVIRVFLFAALLAFPIWTLLACRRLGIPPDMQNWILLVLIATTWFYANFIDYFRWGLVGYATAAYFSPYVLALFLNLIEKPGVKIYLGFCLTGTLLLLFHIVSPAFLIPSLVLYTLAAHPLAIRWRIAIFMAPLLIAALNFYWFYPCLLAMKAPSYPWPPTTLDMATHLRYVEWSQILESMNPIKISAALLGLPLTVLGYTIMKKICGPRAVVSMALAVIVALFLKFFGSFLPIVSMMQPVRFNLPTFVFLAFPVGIALATIAGKARLPINLSAAVVALLAVSLAVILGKPASLSLPPSPDPFADFVLHRTAPADRLLIQSKDGYRYSDYESKAFPMTYGREVIGSNFPLTWDPAQFLRDFLLGKQLSLWSPEELRAAVKRWGIRWVFTQTEEAQGLVSVAFGPEVQKAGDYHIFRVPGETSRMLIGNGKVEAKVNRIELRELRPESGLIVLRYRYHPAWKADGGIPVYRYPVPEDPTGFIALRNPPVRLTLRFDPWAQLHVPWPEPMEEVAFSRD